MPPHRPPPVIVILAGGRATRMGGGDKALRALGTTTLLGHVIDRLGGQGRRIILSANGDPGRFAHFALPVVPDPVPEQLGPLAGILAAMEWAAAHEPHASDLLSVPADTPFLPRDLAARLGAARDAEDAEVACASSQGRVHPVACLWKVALASALRSQLTAGQRRVDAFTGRFRRIHVAFAAEPVDPFFNVNSPEDLQEAERLLRVNPP